MAGLAGSAASLADFIWKNAEAKELEHRAGRYIPTMCGRMILSSTPLMTAENSKSSAWRMNTPDRSWPCRLDGVWATMVAQTLLRLFSRFGTPPFVR